MSMVWIGSIALSDYHSKAFGAVIQGFRYFFATVSTEISVVAFTHLFSPTQVQFIFHYYATPPCTP